MPQIGSATVVSDASETLESPDDQRPEDVDHLVRLCDLRPGQRGRISCMSRCQRRCCGCSKCELLRAMGLCERSHVRLCRIGEPCIIQVASTRLGISRELARSILVSLERQCDD